MTFTESEQALIDEWLTTEVDTLASLQQVLDLAAAEQIKVNLEKTIYQKMQLEALEELDALLLAKAGLGGSVIYGGTHPQNGGIVVTAWEVGHLDVDLVTVIVDYSHSVNWDSDPAILAAEAKWNLFQTWQTSEIFGTDRKLVGLAGAISKTNTWMLAIQARNAEFR